MPSIAIRRQQQLTLTVSRPPQRQHPRPAPLVPAGWPATTCARCWQASYHSRPGQGPSSQRQSQADGRRPPDAAVRKCDKACSASVVGSPIRACPPGPLDSFGAGRRLRREARRAGPAALTLASTARSRCHLSRGWTDRHRRRTVATELCSSGAARARADLFATGCVWMPWPNGHSVGLTVRRIWSES